MRTPPGPAPASGHGGHGATRLRALERADLATLYAWENDRDHWPQSSRRWPVSQDALAELIDNADRDPFETHQLRLMIDVIAGPGGGATSVGRVTESVGCVDLYDIDALDRHAALAILIDPRHRRQGVATRALELMRQQAFEQLGLRALEARVAADNQPSLALFQRAGWAHVGTLAQWTARTNGWVDELIFQTLKG